MTGQEGSLPRLPELPYRPAIRRDFGEQLTVELSIEEDRGELRERLKALPGMSYVPIETIDHIAHEWAIERQIQFDAGHQDAIDGLGDVYWQLGGNTVHPVVPEHEWPPRLNGRPIEARHIRAEVPFLREA